MTKDQNGKLKVEKAGLKEITREGFEYELTLNFNLEINHQATASKDRTGMFMDQPSFVITSETGKKLIEWCNDGEAKVIPSITDEQFNKAMDSDLDTISKFLNAISKDKLKATDGQKMMLQDQLHLLSTQPD